MFEFLKDKIKDITKKITKQTSAKLSVKTKIKEKVAKEFTISEEDLEISLLESDVARDTAEAICEEIKTRLMKTKFKRGENIEKTIQNIFKDTLLNILSSPKHIDIVDVVSKTKPCVIMFLGPNGAGKTTTIAKIAHLLMNKNFSVILAASDTFRAASIEQLEEHAKRLSIKLVKHSYGADPAAVAFDAIKSAKARGIDCVLIDTAGRQETNKNLIEELRKVARVAEPTLKIYVDEALAGNVLVERVKQFDEAVGIDGIILTKMDVDVKGGGAISITKETGRPILYIGVGQEYDDIEPFEPEVIVSRILG